MNSNPLYDAVATYAGILASSLAAKAGFVGLTSSLEVESPLQGTVYQNGVEPAQQVVPVVQHGQPIKGVVVITAPLGEKSTFAGLTVRIHVAKLVKHGGKPQLTEEQKQATESLPKWMQPKDTPITHGFDAPLNVSEDEVVLAPGKYEVDGQIRVPFTIATEALPPLDSFQAADNTEICHWVEAEVALVGWRSWWGYMSEGWAGLNKDSTKQRAAMRKKGGAGAVFANFGGQTPAVEGKLWQPGGKFGHAFQRLLMQVVRPLAADGTVTASPSSEFSLVGSEEDEDALDDETPELPASGFVGRYLAVVASEIGGSCELKQIAVTFSERDGRLCGEVEGYLELSRTKPLDKIELQLLTRIDDAEDPEVTATYAVYQRQAAAVDKATDAASDSAAPAPAPAAAAAPPGITSLSTKVSLDLSEVLQGSAQRLISSHTPDPLDYPADPIDGAYGPHDVHGRTLWRQPSPCKVEHLVQLSLTTVDGKEARRSLVLPVYPRSRITGHPPGELEDGIAPPPPPKMALWKKILLSLLGILSFVIGLSFMAPVKFKWIANLLGVAETAEWCGLLAPKDGAKQSWTRTILATVTQYTKRLLTGHR